MTLLRIDSSARGSSVSRQLTAKFAEDWKQEHPAGRVIERDLSRTRLPQITDEWAATYADPAKLTPEQREYLATSDELIEELHAADTIVIGAPMYNFTISWPLKAWIDQVTRVGKTVAYDAKGPKGLLSGKKTIVITSRGGTYAGTARAAMDFQEPYLRHILGYIGLNDVTFINAENQGNGQAAASREAAVQEIHHVVAQESNACVEAGC
ncbi:MAG TPA: NAD(P)H-dependent oxidoreductase [Candidatus Acidoferrales bacterium]|nr:NAD(P)H-dependent oxidoreductase [Candidatus Acidoferrales bacterium]